MFHMLIMCNTMREPQQVPIRLKFCFGFCFQCYPNVARHSLAPQLQIMAYKEIRMVWDCSIIAPVPPL